MAASHFAASNDSLISVSGCTGVTVDVAIADIIAHLLMAAVLYCAVVCWLLYSASAAAQHPFRRILISHHIITLLPFILSTHTHTQTLSFPNPGHFVLTRISGFESAKSRVLNFWGLCCHGISIVFRYWPVTTCGMVCYVICLWSAGYALPSPVMPSPVPLLSETVAMAFNTDMPTCMSDDRTTG